MNIVEACCILVPLELAVVAGLIGYYGDKIMGNLEDLEAKIDGLTEQAKQANETVEGLYKLISELTNNGISPEAAARLTAKLDTLKEELSKVPTDEPDEEELPPVA